MQGLLFKTEERMDMHTVNQCVVSDLEETDLGPFSTGEIYQRDCIEGMRLIPTDSVDLVIADPPYNLSKGGNWSWDNAVKLPGFGGDWRKAMAIWDDMPLTEYMSFTISWLREVQRVVKPTGSLWVHGTYHNAGIINVCLQLLDIEIINEVIWYKRNSFPNLSGRRLTASHETILWAHTGKKRQYLFNYEASKSMECPEDGLKERGKQLRTVWDIPNNKRKEELAHGKHPTQKPVRLVRRMLEISAKPGSIVLIPFAGAGSECVAVKNFGSRFVGFELEPEYVDVCRMRLGLQTDEGFDLNRTTKKGKASSGIVQTHTRTEIRKSVPSLIKWTGSKRSQAASIVELMPKFESYIEPFLGSGAVLYTVGAGAAIASDIYEPLIALWKLVQKDPNLVIEDYREKWLALSEEIDTLSEFDIKKRSGLPQYYYKVRDRFNCEQDPLDLNFLMRTCVNGIVRFNDEGKFNNSFHLSRRGMEPERFARVVNDWSAVLKNVTFVCQDYEQTVERAQKSDFIYFDPPYAGNHQRYVENLDLVRFFTVLERLNQRGVKWALSFDGRRGDVDLTHDVPGHLFKRQVYLENGISAVHKVLNGPIERVQESLYLNY